MRARFVSTLVVLASVVLFCGISPAQPIPPGGDGSLHIFCIEVGIEEAGDFYAQGDSTLVISPSGTRLLIDGGANVSMGSDSVLELFNRIIPVGGLNYMVTTHWDRDHYGGLDNIAAHNDNQYLPDVIYDLGNAESPADDDWEYSNYMVMFDERRHTPEIGDSIDLGGDCTATFVSVDGYTYGGGYVAPADDDNARSIGLLIKWGGFDYLTLGDLEYEHEDILGDALSGAGYRIDVLHASHHGARATTSSDFLRAILPEFAVISCGNGNTHGHPHAHSLNRLQALTNGGSGLSYPFYNPAQQIYLLETGVATTTVDLNPDVFTVVGDGTYEDMSVHNPQGSLHIEVLNGGCEYYLENEGPHTVDFAHGPYWADNEEVCVDFPRPPATPTPTDCIRMAEESFDNTPFPPAGWTGTATRSTSAHTGTHSVLFNNSSDYLVSPLIHDPGLLVFWIKSTSDTPCFRVEYSTDGVYWADLPGTPFRTDYNSEWTQETYDLRGMGDCFIRFSRCNASPYYLDDIMVLCSNNYPSVLNLFSYNVVPGWNLISYPFVTTRPWGDILSAVGGYEGLRECLYEYDSSDLNYLPVPLSATPSPRKGYWLLTIHPMPTPQIIELDPGEIPVLTRRWEAGIDLFPGWNLIGSVYRTDGSSAPLPVGVDGGEIAGDIFGYSPTRRLYEAAEGITPGCGYWVLYAGYPDGGISIGGSKSSGTKSGAAAGLTAVTEPPPPPGGSAPRVTPTPTKAPTKKPTATPAKAPLMKTTALR